MPISRKVVVVCPKCGYAKTVTRGDKLPDASMFQRCPKCGEMMRDSTKGADTMETIKRAVREALDLFGMKR